VATTSKRRGIPVAVTGIGSPVYVARVQGLRRSGAAGTHASRSDRRARSRAAARRRAVYRDIAAG
jgi:hypothetical protein